MPTKATRRVQRIRLKNVLAIEEADIVVGNGLVITGRTGSGKTAVLDGLKAVFEKNARTRMVRFGENEGDVMLVMSDGMTAARRIVDGQTERLRLTCANGKSVSSPAEHLKTMAPALLLNPLRFVSMDETEKAKVLAEVFPVNLSQEELEAICGEDVDLQGVYPSGNGLARANQAYKAAYNERHTANGEQKQAETSRDAELKKIPAGFNPEAVRNLSSESIAKELARIEHNNRLVVDGQAQMAKLENEEKSLNASIEQIKKELAAKEAQMKEVGSRLENGRKWLSDNKHIDPAATQATLHTLDQQRMYLHSHDQAVAYEAQLKGISSRALRLDAIVATLKALPGVLVRRSNIPIPGLSIEDGVVHVNGLPIGNLSQGEQLRVGVRVAVAGCKDLALVCIDGAEAISEDARDQLIDDLRAQGVQVFMTIADESDFNILDLDGNPVDARVVIKAIETVVNPTEIKAPGVRQPTMSGSPTAPKFPSKTTTPAPVVKQKASLFDPAPEDEVMFGELTL